jgi:DNA-binding transcriptional MerR regulator
MSQAAGTADELAHVTGVPARTIRAWAAAGQLLPVDRVRRGTRHAARYDARAVMRLAARRRGT